MNGRRRPGPVRRALGKLLDGIDCCSILGVVVLASSASGWIWYASGVA